MFILPAIQEHQGMGQSKWHMWIFVSLRTPRKCSWHLSCLHLSGINVVNFFQHNSSHSGDHFENCYSQIFFILQWNIGAPLCHWTQVSSVGAKMGILPKPALTPPSYTGTSDIFSSRGPWSMKLCLSWLLWGACTAAIQWHLTRNQNADFLKTLSCSWMKQSHWTLSSHSLALQVRVLEGKKKKEKIRSPINFSEVKALCH